MSLVLVAAVAGTSIVAGRVHNEIVGRSDGKDFDLNSENSKWSDYQDRAVVVRIEDRNCGITHVANVNRKDLDVRADDECQKSSMCGHSVGVRRNGCGLDRFEIAQGSSRRCWKETILKLLTGSPRSRTTAQSKWYQSCQRLPKVRLQSVCECQEFQSKWQEKKIQK